MKEGTAQCHRCYPWPGVSGWVRTVAKQASWSNTESNIPPHLFLNQAPALTFLLDRLYPSSQITLFNPCLVSVSVLSWWQKADDSRRTRIIPRVSNRLETSFPGILQNTPGRLFGDQSFLCSLPHVYFNFINITGHPHHRTGCYCRLCCCSQEPQLSSPHFSEVRWPDRENKSERLGTFLNCFKLEGVEIASESWSHYVPEWENATSKLKLSRQKLDRTFSYWILLWKVILPDMHGLILRHSPLLPGATPPLCCLCSKSSNHVKQGLRVILIKFILDVQATCNLI